MVILHVAIAIVTALAGAGLFYPALGLKRHQRRWVLLALAVAILLLPLLVPSAARMARFLAAAACLMIVGKLYDLHHAADWTPRPSLATFVAFMANPFTLVLRRLKDEPTPLRRENRLRLARGAAMFIVGEGLGVLVFRAELGAYSFALEHVAKTVCAMIALYGGAEIAIALWRLLGLPGREPMHNFFLAPTPAEFWRRHNRWVYQFFRENFFRRIGGGRSPVLATLVVFGISGLMHEYVFGIAVERVQGFPLAFFMVQGCAVAATMRTKPTGHRALIWIAMTIVFNLASSVLFFASLNRLGPYYSDALPRWLGGP
ncbi:MAG: MBOAT family protein [Planctomycetota bacterium]|nr:MBOAT family protein [Planctomycetota bacterium]